MAGAGNERKGKALIDAVSRLGPLPNFLFSNPIVSGFVAAIMCAVFGAVAFAFQVVGRGAVDTAEVFETARIGAIIGLVIAVFIFLGIAVSAFFQREEAGFRLLFVFGGALGIASLVIADRFASDSLRDWLATIPPLA